MDFSDALPLLGPPPEFSPDGRLVAAAEAPHRLVVRDAGTLEAVAVFALLDRSPDRVAWAPDSDHLLCTLPARAVVTAFSVSDSAWTCTISEGVAGVVAARWSPSGAHVLVTTDFGVRLGVWSLVEQACLSLPGPKQQASASLEFSPDGTQLAVLQVRVPPARREGGDTRGVRPAPPTPTPHPLPQRSNCKDVLALYDARTWQQVARFPLVTQDAAGVAFAPDGEALVVWDSAVYGHLLAVYTPHGERLAEYSAHKELLGIKAAPAWSTSGQLLAVGSYDQVRAAALVLASCTPAWRQQLCPPAPARRRCACSTASPGARSPRLCTPA